MTRTPGDDEFAPPWGSPGPLGPSSRLLRRDRDGQPLSTLSSPSPQNVTATRRGHTGEKAMGSLAACITWLKGSLHEVRAYPSQRLAAVNLVVTQLLPLRYHRWTWSWNALRISTQWRGASDNLPTNRSCIVPSGVNLHATACSVGRSSFSPPPRRHILRTYRCLSTFVTVLLNTNRHGRVRAASSPSGGMFHIAPGMASNPGVGSARDLPVGREGATW